MASRVCVFYAVQVHCAIVRKRCERGFKPSFASNAYRDTDESPFICILAIPLVRVRVQAVGDEQRGNNNKANFVVFATLFCLYSWPQGEPVEGEKIWNLEPSTLMPIGKSRK